MLLHRLQISAFGPFADTVQVDFDDLSTDGLFLLTGPTGAGKTSVLDAVCFGLYGDVPGDRSSAKRLRCDLAARGAGPRVVLTATLSGRLFRFTRSPGWDRPRKRGAGTTPEHAKVLVEERAEGEWVLLTNRMDEAGQLVTDLLGMTMTQFCQVAMLPQGRFQQFLSAGSKERQQLLQQLFATQRFADIEVWLRNHTRSLHRSSTSHHQAVAAITHRILEVADTTLPDDWPEETPEDLAAVAASGQLEAWSAGRTHAADAAAGIAEERAAESAESADAARRARVEGGRLHDLQQRHAAASRALAELDAEAEAHEDRVTRLDRARRADPVRPLVDLARTRTRQRDHAAREAAHASLASLSLLGDAALFDWADQADPEQGLRDLDDAVLSQALAAARGARARAEALRPREQELARLETTIHESRSAAHELEAAVESRRSLVQTLPDQISSLSNRLEASREAQTRVSVLRGQIDELDTRLDAHARLERVLSDAEAAHRDLRACIDQCQSLKEAWLELREARLHGMAAEMARDLAVGGSCPVCGSEEHPAKAVPAPGSPSAETEKQARARLETEEATRVALEDKVRDLDVRLARVQQEAGETLPEELRSRRGLLEAELTTAQASAAGMSGFEPTLARLTQSLDRAHHELTARSSELSALTTRIETDRAAVARIEAELAELLSDTASDTISDLCNELDHAVHTHTRAEQARATWRAAEEACAESARMLRDWVADQGFADADEALGASLPRPDLQALADQVRSHEDRVTTARATLDDPDVAGAIDQPAPDLVALDTEATRAVELAEDLQAHARLSRQQSARLSSLNAELDSALRAWAPVREAHTTAAGLAAFVGGKSPENDLRMRLSAYVLAWRLAQVVAAANERLVTMTNQRYTLEHTGRRGARETRGGLSLLVRDEWSGEARDPATLSGGETFVVSLALALGLADVVTREAGGADLHTLFVDEGFGALDAETLDDVMDTLDGLRDGGRVVGVVSHVSEMRSRIPMQLAVTKDRSGSRLRVTRRVA